YMWGRIAKAAQGKLAAGGDAAALQARLVTARFFMERTLPETGAHLARIVSGSDSTMALSAEQF
ncbi:acyl-CoA dehydrogenase C-terminal domain-containing protein, partial [Mycobacterium tuberculosis]|nr:acyl-CoA dehydrogenase C-terminal domain-containing protein [Mycobacterium tuberculosis]